MISDSGRPGLSPRAPASSSANEDAARGEGEEARRNAKGRLVRQTIWPFVDTGDGCLGEDVSLNCDLTSPLMSVGLKLAVESQVRKLKRVIKNINFQKKTFLEIRETALVIISNYETRCNAKWASDRWSSEEVQLGGQRARWVEHSSHKFIVFKETAFALTGKWVILKLSVVFSEIQDPLIYIKYSLY